MQPYKDLNNDSGVHAFETGNDYIKVQFNSGYVYTYAYTSAGSTNIEQMKKLALAGDGLNSYIKRNNPSFSSKY